MREEKIALGNLIVPDTNVLINDPYCLDRFINGGNKVIIPLTVLTELDRLKKDLRIGIDVREVIRQIEKFGFGKNERFEVEKNTSFAGIDLEKGRPDYQIMATLNYIISNEKYEGYDLYKLVTNDVNMRIMAYALFKDKVKVSIEPYKQEQIEQKNAREEIATVHVEDFSPDMAIDYSEEIHGVLNQNAGIIISYPDKKDGIKENLFVRKGGVLQMIKNDFSLFGLEAADDDERRGVPNYGQLLAFHHLSSPEISCVFLEGQAGTGKTLIALAAGLSQRKKFEHMIIANPMVPLSNKTNMGFLPGDIADKTAPWLVPFEQNLRFLEKHSPDRMAKLTVSNGKKASANGKFTPGDQQEISMRIKYGLIPQPLEYIRGQTIADAFIIIEEAQNLSQHEMKTIITRLGKGSRVIFCGDLSQIDIPYLNEYSSGLTYAIEKMVGQSEKNRMIATVMLTRTVRSELAAFASEVL